MSAFALLLLVLSVFGDQGIFRIKRLVRDRALLEGEGSPSRLQALGPSQRAAEEPAEEVGHGARRRRRRVEAVGLVAGHVPVAALLAEELELVAVLGRQVLVVVRELDACHDVALRISSSSRTSSAC